MADIKKLERSRNTAHKGIENLIKRAEDYIVKSENDSDFRKLISTRDILLEKIIKVKSLDEQIMDCLLDIDTSNIDEEEETSTNFSLMFKEKLSLIESFVNKKQKPIESSTSSFSFSN